MINYYYADLIHDVDLIIKKMDSVFFFFNPHCRINGSIPNNAEIRDNVLIFKGPLTYDVQGTYVCDATNSIGTRSASVEVGIIGWFYSAAVIKMTPLVLRSFCRERNHSVFSFRLKLGPPV